MPRRKRGELTDAQKRLIAGNAEIDSLEAQWAAEGRPRTKTSHPKLSELKDKVEKEKNAPLWKRLRRTSGGLK